MKRRILTFALLLALVPASLVLAGAEGRLKGIVVDKDGKPIAGAAVQLTAQEVFAQRQATTKKNGKFAMIVADATRSYVIRIEKEGYQTIQEPLKLDVGGQVDRTWTLREGETVAGAAIVDKRALGAKVYNEGAKAFNNGEIDVALAKFQQASAENPELVEAFQGQAMIHWSREETDPALAAAEKIYALDPTNVLGLRIRYDAYVAKGDERADQVLQELVAADPTPATAPRVFNAGVAAVRANDADKAIARFEQAVEIDPSLSQGHKILGQLYNSKKQHDKAIASAEKLLALDPDGTEAHTILYQAYNATGDTAMAEKSYAVLKAANPEDLAQTFFEQGKARWDAGDAAGAIEQLKQAVETQPDYALAHYFLGLAYAGTDVKAALEHLQKSLDLDPAHQEAASAKSMLDYYRNQ
jgi:tetratricopeptide (TPR) repeat protein